MTETISKEGVPKFDRYNKSTLYLLPLIAKSIDLDFHHLIENTFIGIEDDGIEYPIGILYNIGDLKDEPENMFFAYDLVLKTNPLYAYTTDIDDSHRAYIFNFPEKYLPEYSKFRTGKYSKFGEKAKGEIISYTAMTYKYQPVVEDIAGVLFKKKERRAKLEKLLVMSIPEDVELASIVNMEDETLKDYYK